MKKIGLFIVLLVTFFFVIFPKDSKAQSDFVKQRVANATTVGNNTYIKLGLRDNPGNKALTILWIIKNFEERNPKLEVVSWKIEKQQFTRDSFEFIFGIFIQHKPNPYYKKPKK